MVRLLVGADTDALEPWFNIVLCVPVGGAFRVEAQLFSPTREVKQRWQSLWGSATAT
jgi:hypothetical protein